VSDGRTELQCGVVTGGRWVFAFEMKFYATEPATLHEDLTRSAATAASNYAH